ncbi:hypothetical protein [Spirosoma aerolatum]|uniref:hypothetical protein n=1 Tax=Spirosoma aerolatum TaxID=1211326 RepID=UPI0009AD7516|nr:hypothetical protein [Spirosoma aerolatum]
MFKSYSTIAEAIKKQVKVLRWFDLDKGQLDDPERYNSIITPGILIGNSEITWSQGSSRAQIGDGTVTVKLVLRLPAQTHLTEPLLFENLKALELGDSIDDAVQNVPGVLSRTKYRDYPVDSFYVVEQTFLVQYKKERTYSLKTVSLKINPQLVNPNES